LEGAAVCACDVTAQAITRQPSNKTASAEDDGPEV
jgi:hypothetical protein